MVGTAATTAVGDICHRLALAPTPGRAFAMAVIIMAMEFIGAGDERTGGAYSLEDQPSELPAAHSRAILPVCRSAASLQGADEAPAEA